MSDREILNKYGMKKEDIDYIRDYKETHKDYLKKIRPEILNLTTIGEIGTFLYDNPSIKLSKAELSYLFEVVYQMPVPSSSLKKDDLEHKLRHYFDNILRVADLAKNSCYW